MAEYGGKKKRGKGNRRKGHKHRGPKGHMFKKMMKELREYMEESDLMDIYEDFQICIARAKDMVG